MRIYTKIVFDSQGSVVEQESYDYNGPVAVAKGPEPAKPTQSAAGKILLQDLRKPLSGALREDIINDPFQNEASAQYKNMLSQVRGSYGARGLAGSGIAIQGEQQGISDIQAKMQAARAGQLIGILGTGGSSPSVVPGSPPRGFMGLK